MSDRHRAAKVGAVVELVRVSLRSVEARLPRIEQLGGNAEFDISWETSHERSSADTIRYCYRLAIDTPPPHDLRIDCAFELDYRVPSDVDLDEDDLIAFGEVSARFSGFPYARELVQSLTTRASLPPLVLGTLRAPIDPPASD